MLARDEELARRLQEQGQVLGQGWGLEDEFDEEADI